MGVFKNGLFCGIIESGAPSQSVLDYWTNRAVTTGARYKLRAFTAADRVRQAAGFVVKF